MKIESPLPKKNHNISSESDGYRFIRYVGFFIALIFGIYIFFILLSYVIVLGVSIEDEKEWFGSGSISSVYNPQSLPTALSERYSEVPYEISLIDMEGANAFADLGGQIYVTQDLLEEIEYIQELDFIIGHEIGHIEKRHVLKALISDAPLTLILSVFGGEYGQTLFTGILSNNYSKIHETSSDRYGLDFTYELNGHIGCALGFFEKNSTLISNSLELFSTHPMSNFRITRTQQYAEKKGYEQGNCEAIQL